MITVGGGKKGNAKAKKQPATTHDFRQNGLRSLSMSFLNKRFTKVLEPKAKSFSLHGAIHLQVVCNEQMTLSEVIDEMICDFDRQI